MPTTYSAGTYDAQICKICDATTEFRTDTPHPSYTNEKGDVVIQTTMVTAGGFNGLNN